MVETDPSAIPYTKPFNFAEMIGWGYLTNWDFDEALRVYIEKTQADGLTLVYHQSDLLMARRAFELEIGDKES